MSWLQQAVRTSHRRVPALILAGVLLLLALKTAFPSLFRSGRFSSPSGWSEIKALTPTESWVSSSATAPFGEGYAMALVVPGEDGFNLAWLSSRGPGAPKDEANSLLGTSEPVTGPRLAMNTERREGHLSWVRLGPEGSQQLWYGRFRPGAPVGHPAPVTTMRDPIAAHSLALDSSGKPHLVWAKGLEDGYSVIYHTTIGEKGIRTQPLSQGRRMAASPVIWSGKDEVYAAWVEAQPDPREDSLILSLLGSDGQIITQPTPVDTGMGPIMQPSLAPADRGNVLVVWVTDDVPLGGPFGRRRGERLLGLLVDASAKPLTRPVTLARSRRPSGDYQAARDARGAYHLVWSELGPDGWSIWYRKIGPRLKPTGPAVELSEPGLGGSRVQVVTTSTGHVQVFWTNTTSNGTTVLSRWK